MPKLEQRTLSINGINFLVNLLYRLSVFESVGAKVRSKGESKQFIPKVGMSQLEFGEILYAHIRTEPATASIPPP